MSKQNSIQLRDIFKERLRNAMDQTGFVGRGEKKKLAEAMAEAMKGIENFTFTPTSVTNALNGTMPGSEALFAFSVVLKKSMDWFLGREREIVRPPDLTIDLTPKLRAFSAQHPLSRNHYVPIRLLKDQIAAGHPTSIQPDNLDGWVLIYRSDEWMPHDPENYTCAHVRGYSMSPVLEPGDIVAIDHADRDAADLHNKMVVFREGAVDDNYVTVKWLRYHKETNVIFAEPENRQERDTGFSISGSEAYERIVGRVAWWWAKR